MAYPQTGSLLYDPTTNKNRIGTALSTNIIISVNNTPIGAVQQLVITEARSIKPIDEIGTDGHVDSAPQSSTTISGSCTRIRFDRMRIAEAFSRGFVHLAAQRYPFDIDIIDTWKGDQSNSVVTTLRNVWLTNITTTYSATDFIISDQMSYMCESIESKYNGTSNNVADGGSRGIPFFIDPIERSADVGGRRGSMDAPGLINAFAADSPLF